MTGRGVLSMQIVVVDLGTEIPLDLMEVIIEHFAAFRRRPLSAKDSSENNWYILFSIFQYD